MDDMAQEQHIYRDLWTAIVNERRRQGVTMQELSDRTGIPEVTLGKWLRGETAAPYVRVVKLASALNIDVQATVTGGIPTEVAA